MTELRVHIDSLSWAAGVLDGAGRFQIRRQKGMPSGARVYASVGKKTAETLADVLGGKAVDGAWVCPANEQEAVLGKILPYMQGRYEQASRVYRLRLTAPRRQPGWRVSKAVGTFRDKL